MKLFIVITGMIVGALAAYAGRFDIAAFTNTAAILASLNIK